MYVTILSSLGSAAFASPVGSIDLGTSADVAMSGGIYGTGLGDQFGHAMTTGDLNGDGQPDLVATAVGMDMVHIFFGPITGDPTVADADATYQGSLGGEAGWAIAVGDLTDDGQDDLVVSEPSNLAGAGEVYVIEGPLTGGGTYYDSSHPSVVYAFEGRPGPRKWYAAWDLTIGDFDEDGKQDLALGICEARYEGPMGVDPVNRAVGLVALISQDDMTPGARHSLFTDSTSLIWGIGHTGCSIDNAGDTNGDGIEDIVVGSWRLSRSVPGMPNIQSFGAGTVIEGRETWAPTIEMATYFESDLELLTLPGIYHLIGPDLQGLNLGRSVSPAGDVNGDGYDDILLGAPALDRDASTLAPTSTASRAYLVYGASDTNGLQGSSPVEDVYGARFDASHATHLGIDTSYVDDLDGDGSPELLLGGLLGEGYLFAGVHDPTFQPTYSCVTAGNCTVSLPATGGLQGLIGLGSATATFSGASSSSAAGSPGNFAGRVFVGGADLTGAGVPTLMVGAPAQARAGSTNNGAGWVYLVEGN